MWVFYSPNNSSLLTFVIVVLVLAKLVDIVL